MEEIAQGQDQLEKLLREATFDLESMFAQEDAPKEDAKKTEPAPESEPEAEKPEAETPATEEDAPEVEPIVEEGKAEKVAELTERIAALEEALAKKGDAPQPSYDTSDPLAKATTEEDVAKAEVNAKAWRSWCLRNLLGGKPPVKDAEDLTADEVADRLEDAEEILNAAPKRRAYLAAFATQRAETRKSYPEMFKAGTPENALREKIVKQLMAFSSQADQDRIVATLVKAARAEAAGKRAPEQPKPRLSATFTATPPTRAVVKAEEKQSPWKAFETMPSGSSIDFEELMA